MKQWFFVFIICLSALAVFFFACDSGDDDSTESDGPDDDTPDDDDDADDDDDDLPPARAFYMAAAPFRFLVTDTSISSEFDFTGFEGRVDIISLHMDNFFGIPWDEFASGSPLPQPWLEKMTWIKQSADQLGVKIYLSLTPLSGLRNGLGAKATDQDGVLVVDDGWADGCYSFDTGEAHEQIQTAYLNYVRWMVDFFKPDYLTHGIEINMYDVACSGDYDSLLALLNRVYDQEKEHDPELPIFATFTSGDMYQQGAGDDCGPSNHACLLENIDKIALLKQDRFGISSYPIWEFNEFGDWPEDYFTAFADVTGKKLVVAETGWGSHNVTVPWPTLEDDCLLVTESTDAMQMDYMEFLFDSAQTSGTDFVVWWSLRDYLDGPVLDSCPCTAPGLWCLLYEAMYDIGLLPAFLMWGSMGVIDFDAEPKPALTTWEKWLDRPVGGRR